MNVEERRAIMTQTRIREEVIPIGDESQPEPRGRRRQWCCTGGFCAGLYVGFAFGLFSFPLLCCLPLQRKQKFDYAKGAGTGLICTWVLIYVLRLDYSYMHHGIIASVFSHLVT